MLALGAWALLLGACALVLRAWTLRLNASALALGAWARILGACALALRASALALGARPLASGASRVAAGAPASGTSSASPACSMRAMLCGRELGAPAASCGRGAGARTGMMLGASAKLRAPDWVMLYSSSGCCWPAALMGCVGARDVEGSAGAGADGPPGSSEPAWVLSDLAAVSRAA